MKHKHRKLIDQVAREYHRKESEAHFKFVLMEVSEKFFAERLATFKTIFIK